MKNQTEMQNNIIDLYNRYLKAYQTLSYETDWHAVLGIKDETILRKLRDMYSGKRECGTAAKGTLTVDGTEITLSFGYADGKGTYSAVEICGRVYEETFYTSARTFHSYLTVIRAFNQYYEEKIGMTLLELAETARKLAATAE